jgi:tetratricopeptide (TPR) repeat protein
VAGRSPWFYLEKLICPIDLSAVYPRWQLAPESFGQWLYPTITILVSVVLAVKRSLWGGSLWYGWLAWLALLSPAMGIISHSTMDLSFVADHYQYLASLVPIALLSMAWTKVPTKPALAVGGGLVVLIILAGFTWQRAGVFNGPIALWSDAAVKNPTHWVVWNNLGSAYLAEENPERASLCFQKAAELDPLSEKIQVNLGITANLRGNRAEALVHFTKAIELNPASDYAEYRMGRFLGEIGDSTTAIQHLQRAVNLNPRHLEAWNSLGVLLIEQDKHQQALEAFEAALRIDQEHPNAQRNRKQLLREMTQDTASEASNP